MKLIESHDESLDTVKQKVSDMLKSATDHIRIGTGLSRGLLNEEPVKSAMVSALTRVSKVDILLDVDTVMDSKFQWLYSSPKVEVRQSRETTPHRIIVDLSTVRLEKPHDREVEVRNNLMIFDCDPVAARILVNEFDQDFADAAPIDLPD